MLFLYTYIKITCQLFLYKYIKSNPEDRYKILIFNFCGVNFGVKLKQKKLSDYPMYI